MYPTVLWSTGTIDAHAYIDTVAEGELTARWEGQVGPVLVDKLAGDWWDRTTIEEPWSEEGSQPELRSFPADALGLLDSPDCSF